MGAAIRLLGVRVDALTAEDLDALVETAVETRSKLVVVSQNLHGIYVTHRSREMRALHDRALVRIDGMPLVFWGRLLGYRLRSEHRVTWVDWMDRLAARAAEADWRIFYLGGPAGVAEAGMAEIRKKYPRLKVCTHHGFFDTSGTENSAVTTAINSYDPDVLLVGMGMPRQEEWVLENVERVSAPVVLTCGAAIEYFAGTMALPPRWMGRIGLEWIFRLLSQPRRLWKRYLLEPWYLGGLAAHDVWRRLSNRDEQHV